MLWEKDEFFFVREFVEDVAINIKIDPSDVTDAWVNLILFLVDWS